MDEFFADCKLVTENCKLYYGGREDGKIFYDQAERLNSVLQQQIDSFVRYIKSPPGMELKAKMSAKMSPNGPPLFPEPTPDVLMQVLEDLRSLSYTDKSTKVRRCLLLSPASAMIFNCVFMEVLTFASRL